MTTRQMAQEKIRQTIQHLNKAGENLFMVSELYREYHPEMSTPIDMLLKGLAKTIDALDQLQQTF